MSNTPNMWRLITAAAVLIVLLAVPARAGFEEGEAAFAEGDYDKAYNEWMPLAKEGDARAQWGVAHLHLLGLGVIQDVEVGARWAEKSANQGYVEGLSLLAALYERGVGVTKDWAKSIQLRKRAAETGDALAQYNLAVKYLQGQMVHKDVGAALGLLRSAARQNLQAAMFNLGVLFFKNEDVPEDLVRSYMWFELAASWESGSNGDVPIGSMAETGERATQFKTMLSAQMTSSQVSEAQRLAREWTEKNEAR